jgi:hypothetical protein
MGANLDILSSSPGVRAVSERWWIHLKADEWGPDSDCFSSSLSVGALSERWWIQLKAAE